MVWCGVVWCGVERILLIDGFIINHNIIHITTLPSYHFLSYCLRILNYSTSPFSLSTILILLILLQLLSHIPLFLFRLLPLLLLLPPLLLSLLYSYSTPYSPLAQLLTPLLAPPLTSPLTPLLTLP